MNRVCPKSRPIVGFALASLGSGLAGTACTHVERSVMERGALVSSRLAAHGWSEHVGDGRGLWVSVSRQRVVVIDGGRVEVEFRCSTAARGVGQREGTRQTPLGWHEVAEKVGDGLAEGAVLRDREFTGKVWQSGAPAEGDLILTRILRLRGIEPGRNAGPGVDSYARYIYIHGTSAEGELGRPASAGCVRMGNRDVIDLFDRVRVGTPVLITEE